MINNIKNTIHDGNQNSYVARTYDPKNLIEIKNNNPLSNKTSIANDQEVDI